MTPILLLLAVVEAHPQPAGKIRTVGFISMGNPSANPYQLDAFRAGLRELGWIEGQRVTILDRWAGDKAEPFPGLIAELAGLKVDVLVVGTGSGARAAKAAGLAIPVVFAGVGDPVALGVVESLARPGGNITGTSLAFGDQFSGKWVEMLKDAVPSLSRAAVLLPGSTTVPASYGAHYRSLMGSAAQTLGVQLSWLGARDASELERALAQVAKERPQGLIVIPAQLSFGHRAQIADFALKNRLPTIFGGREHAVAGGLLSYGASLADSYRRAAIYVDKILKGAKPADLPVEQPTRFELVVNLRTAKALGLRIPQSVIVRADELIQ